MPPSVHTLELCLGLGPYFPILPSLPLLTMAPALSVKTRGQDFPVFSAWVETSERNKEVSQRADTGHPLALTAQYLFSGTGRGRLQSPA